MCGAWLARRVRDPGKDGLTLEWSTLAPRPALIDLSRVKSLILSVVLALALLSATGARAESSWGTDYKKAQEEAKADHRLVLLNFTGSDWCGYCIQLDRAILSKPEFKDYASKNLVLVEVDFPRRGGPRWNAQSSELKKQNEELGAKFQIEGFPTLILMDGDGKTVWRYDGYYSGGLAAFLAELNKVHRG